MHRIKTDFDKTLYYKIILAPPTDCVPLIMAHLFKPKSNVFEFHRDEVWGKATYGIQQLVLSFSDVIYLGVNFYISVIYTI